MGWTKRDYVTAAMEEIGLGSYAFEIAPEHEQMALRRLDAMVAEWSARGIRIPWPIASGTEIDPTQQSDAPDTARQAIMTNLAIRLAGPFGKTVSAELKITARQSLTNLVRDAARIPEMQMPGGMPLGAGNSRTALFTDPPIESGDVEAAVSYDDL